MNKAIIKKQKFLFVTKNSNNKNLSILSAFLTIDAINDIPGIMEWFYNPDKYYCPTEIYYADFAEDGKNVIIGFNFKKGHEITIPKDIFIQIIHEWDKIIKTEPNKIIITEENGKYSFDAEY